MASSCGWLPTADTVRNFGVNYTLTYISLYFSLYVNAGYNLIILPLTFSSISYNSLNILHKYIPYILIPLHFLDILFRLSSLLFPHITKDKPILHLTIFSQLNETEFPGSRRQETTTKIRVKYNPWAICALVRWTSTINCTPDLHYNSDHQNPTQRTSKSNIPREKNEEEFHYPFSRVFLKLVGGGGGESQKPSLTPIKIEGRKRRVCFQLYAMLRPGGGGGRKSQHVVKTAALGGCLRHSSLITQGKEKKSQVKNERCTVKLQTLFCPSYSFPWNSTTADVLYNCGQ